MCNYQTATRLWLWFSLTVVLSPGANAQQVTSDLELSAAYCLGIQNTELDASLSLSQRDNDPDCNRKTFSEYVALCRQIQQDEKTHQQAIRHDMSRLQAYLRAKGFNGTPDITTADGFAFNRGKADSAETTAHFETPQSQACLAACAQQPPNGVFGKDGEQVRQCVNACDPEDDSNGTFARMERCGEVLKKLPF